MRRNYSQLNSSSLSFVTFQKNIAKKLRCLRFLFQIEFCSNFKDKIEQNSLFTKKFHSSFKSISRAIFTKLEGNARKTPDVRSSGLRGGRWLWNFIWKHTIDTIKKRD